MWIAVVVCIVSCKENEEYPIVPAISFKSLGTMLAQNGNDSMGVIVISFTDGDGDLGLHPDDTLPPFNSGSQYYRNFQLELFEKVNGNWVLNPLSPQLGGRMPYLTPEGSNKALKGDIQMETNLPINKTMDTLFFNVFIYDRELHKSNVVQTSEIIINTN